MAKHTFEVECECESCEGTGLYVGMAERNGAAVVCSRCKGNGARMLQIEYRDFEGRKPHKEARRVYQANPGIIIGVSQEKNLALESYGGIPYEDWLKGRKFGPGTENRAHTCPAWFYQSADHRKKPDWDECWSSLGGTFSSCKHFCDKEKCWARWDREFGVWQEESEK